MHSLDCLAVRRTLFETGIELDIITKTEDVQIQMYVVIYDRDDRICHVYARSEHEM